MTKKTKKETSEEKFTLVELVSNSDLHYPLIIMNLSRAGLLRQYEEEVEVYGRLDIEPSMTLTEFNKIMEA
ncbi:hypothetical protein [uncultured Methanobrevibacter sp.]|uniref:hypothetical protein n=1 Tax=uncultured Methanobrevibacter sp. TaxID=253161 RepID=UPI0025D361AC|nr:hypothetical protein [uncultured Methanobrevibacter sp.]